MLRKPVFVILFSVLALAAGDVSAELVLRYTFDDGTAGDSAGYYENADGTFFGDAHVAEDPCRGQVLVLDGTGDYVKVLNNQVAEFSTESFSYAFWANTKFVGDWYYFWKGIDYCGADGDDLHGANIYHDDSAWIRFTLYAYGGCDVANKVRTDVPDANCITGQWIHVACVRDADDTELRFYINGKLEPTDSVDTNPNTDTVGDISNTGNLYIGCNDRGYPEPNPAEFFDGMIDDFQVYNHALSEQELEWLVLGLTDPNLASKPIPSDGSQNECTDVVLSWTAGENAVLHDVYFGTDSQDVRNATTLDVGIYKGRRSENSYDAGTLESPQEGKTYYWRVDEVGSGSEIWKGDVWRFRINDGKAHSPDPGNGATLVPLDKVLSWSAGCEAAAHRVFFGTDLDDVNNATTSSSAYKGQQSLGEMSYDDPCDFSYSTNYYWRIDEVNGATTWKGNLWTFRTRSRIVDPNLRVWYKLDETEGLIAADSSGREYDGTVTGDSTWDPDGHYDGCMVFDDDGSIIVPSPVLGQIDKQITVSVWLNNSVWEGDNTAFQAGADWEDYLVTVAVPDDSHDITWRAGDEVNDLTYYDRANPRAWVGAWNHFAFTKNENETKMEIYLNGILVAEKSDTSADVLANVRDRRIKIASPTDDPSDYQGKIDDFRVYDRALSAGEIEAIFRGGNLGMAWAPEPENQAVEVPRDVVVNWRPGDYAVTHQVYFGAGYDDVNDAGTLSAEYKGPQNFDVNNYDPPGELDFSTNYYWRIDEVNGPNTWKGDVWQFTVANFIIVDDMESYDAVTGSGNEIFDTWDDGFNNYTGAQIALEYGPGATVHEGLQSLKFGYSSTLGVLKYSEIDANTTGPVPGNLKVGKDWSLFGLKALTLFFYGDPNNDATEQMYLVLEDSPGHLAIAKYGDNGEDMNDIKKDDWQQWNIDLADINDAGVDIRDVNKVRIGFGDRDNPVVGGSGEVFFDDIRLYLPRCVPSMLKPQYDFSNNCIVDLADVAMMAESWLRHDKFVATAPPGDPIVHYEFEETSGSNVSDSTTNNYDGTAYLETGSTTDALWQAGGRFGRCIRFENAVKKYCVKMPTAVLSHITDAISISLWVNWDEPQTMPDETNQLFSVHGGPGDTYEPIIGIETSWRNRDIRFWDAATNAKYEPTLSDWSGGWNHYAFVKDITAEKLRIYLNVDLVAEADSNSPVVLPADNAWLGMATDEPDDWHDEYTGLVDDFRIYDYALSTDEIGYIASDNTTYIPLTSAFNIHDKESDGSKAINFRDMALLAGDWLDEQLWPTN